MSTDYERDIAKLLVEKNLELESLKKKRRADAMKVQTLIGEIESLQTVFENYNLGMNYFRRAKGGRAGLRE